MKISVSEHIQHSTCIIEGAWGNIKAWIKSIYALILPVNLILFLSETQFRFTLNKSTNSKKKKNNFKLYDDDELLDKDNYDF